MLYQLVCFSSRVFHANWLYLWSLSLPISPSLWSSRVHFCLAHFSLSLCLNSLTWRQNVNYDPEAMRMSLAECELPLRDTNYKNLKSLFQTGQKHWNLKICVSSNVIVLVKSLIQFSDSSDPSVIHASDFLRRHLTFDCRWMTNKKFCIYVFGICILIARKNLLSYDQAWFLFIVPSQ